MTTIFSCSKNEVKELQEIKFTYKSYVDKINEYSIKEFKEIPFEGLKNLNFPFFKGAIWIEIKLKNIGNEKKEIVIQNNDRINWNYDLFKLNETKDKLFLDKIKDVKYKDSRTFNFTKPNFKIILNPHQEKTVFLHTTSCGRVVRATPSIVSLNQFIKIMNLETIKNIFFYGVLFIIFLINVFYWKVFKRKVYFMYVLYIVSTGFFYVGFDGYLYGIGIPINIAEHIVFVLFRCLVFSLMMFSATFLNIKKTKPKFYSFLKKYTLFVIITTSLYQFFFCIDKVGEIHVVEFFFGFGWLILLINMIVISRKRSETKYYVLAMSVVLAFVLIGIMNIYLTTEVTGKVFFKIGTTLEFVIFTYTTALILKRNIKKVQEYEQQQIALKYTNEELKLQLIKINNAQFKKTDLLSIFKLLEYNLTNKEEWISFKNKYQELNPNFLSNLLKVHSNLSKTELRLLILVKIGFTQKEISTMLYIVESSVKKAKQRVRKKMNVNNTLSLSGYLSGF